MKELLDIAKGEVERLDSIVNQFLRAVRPSRPDFAPLDLKELIVESLNFMRHEIEGRSVEVKCAWPDFLPKVNGDADQLKQAFYNLIKNALQAMPDGGSLEINCSAGEDGVRLSFSDTGSGIGAAEISKIFEPYQTTKKEGSGLGLVIVDRIIREHGAELSVDSAVGKGTVFNIHFPPRGRRLRILPAPQQEEFKILDAVALEPKKNSP